MEEMKKTEENDKNLNVGGSIKSLEDDTKRKAKEMVSKIFMNFENST